MKKLSKKIILAICLIWIGVFCAPIYFAQAFGWGGILNFLGTFALSSVTAIITPILWLTIGIGTGLLALQGLLLDWAISNPFAFSYTNPATNPVINIGWTLLRDITNTLFILGLAYIGIATALNLGGFNTKKTFGRLIVAALLINFTPVICGTIVDASNLVMNLFTSNISGAFNAFGQVVNTSDLGPFLKDLLISFTPVGVVKLIMVVVYTYFTSCVLFIFTFLFLARHIAIWILVITSPIAFFCWIFDSTRKHYLSWWNQFIHWTFIGITASFALYLSGHLLNAFAGK